MAPTRLEIFRLEIEFRESKKNRPVVVVALVDGDAVVALLSAEMDLYESRRGFLISDDDAEFATTGLDRACYVFTGFVARVSQGKLTEKLGSFGPQLSERFDMWWDIMRLT